MLAHLLASLGLVLTLDHGRVFNLEEGAWTRAAQPGVEATIGPLVATAVWTYGDREGYLTRDLTLAFERVIGTRFTITASAARYSYRTLDSDVVYSTGVRWRLR